jgi:hypothetical protein
MTFIQTEAIRRIEVYKLDFWCYDSIAFDIHLTDGSVVPCCEEDDNWESIEALVQSLPLLASDWRAKVTFSAFEERRMVIYERTRLM